MISIKIPKENEFINEINYILKIMLKDFMKIDYQIDYHEFSNYSLIVSSNKKIVIEFDKNGYEKKINNLPKKIIFQTKKDNQFIIENDIPIIFGKNSPIEIVEKNEEKIIYCPIDIFASSFFMLTRWEEYINPIKDKHGRFPGKESTAYKNNFLDRPIVNEYVEMLWNMLEFLKLKQEKIKREFKINITCDLDHPFDMSASSFPHFLKKLGADIILRHNLQKASRTVKNYYSKSIKYVYLF